MTLAEFLLTQERRYWRYLFSCLPSGSACGRVAGISRKQVYRCIAKCGVDIKNPGRCSPPMDPIERGMLLADYLNRHERWYWRRLLSGRTIREAVTIAGVSHCCMYERFQRLGMKPWKQNTGNAAWQALAPKKARAKSVTRTIQRRPVVASAQGVSQ